MMKANGHYCIDYSFLFIYEIRMAKYSIANDELKQAQEELETRASIIDLLQTRISLLVIF